MDWSFQIGSCALKMFPLYLYSFQIFQTMQHRPADFMIWTGDHVYMLNPRQWSSKEAMRKAYLNQRKTSKLDSFMKSRPQYAIWDDHDYGPNNAGSEFVNKNMALEVFKEMWPNQPQANSEGGVYFSFTHKDAQFFMLDARYFKIPEKQVLGDTQLHWLCEELKKSKAPFKFIVSGVQVLCEGGFENLRKFPNEFNQILNCIDSHKIGGVIFLTGDVHYAEVSLEERANAYPLYDFTFSPLTSLPINYFVDNTKQIEGTKKNTYNFGELSFSGEIGNRLCNVKCLGLKGDTLWSFQLNENDLKYK